MTMVDTLQRTLEIVKQGWCKGGYTDTAGNHCILGAMTKAAGDVPFSAWFAAREAVRAQIGSESIAGFNDAISTTHQDVINVLEKALAEAGGLA